jgi:hypothetical protein
MIYFSIRLGSSQPLSRSYHHKTFEHSQEISEFENGGAETIPSLENILTLSMYKLRIFSAPHLNVYSSTIIKFFEYSQRNSQLKYLRMRELRKVSVCTSLKDVINLWRVRWRNAINSPLKWDIGSFVDPHDLFSCCLFWGLPRPMLPIQWSYVAFLQLFVSSHPSNSAIVPQSIIICSSCPPSCLFDKIFLKFEQFTYDE